MWRRETAKTAVECAFGPADVKVILRSRTADTHVGRRMVFRSDDNQGFVYIFSLQRKSLA